MLRVARSLGFAVIAPFKGEDQFHRDRSQTTSFPIRKGEEIDWPTNCGQCKKLFTLSQMFPVTVQYMV